MAYFDTLGKLMRSPRDTLTITCGRCEHRAVWSRARALAAFGEWAMPCDVGRGLVCSRCRQTRNITVTL